MKITASIRRMLSAGFIVTLMSLYAVPAWALELIMVEQSICPYCKLFDTEVGVDYAETEAGKLAPLRRLDRKADWPEDLVNVVPEQLTPTFILVDDGVEVGRLRGYPGKEEFWDLLNQLLDKHKKD